MPKARPLDLAGAMVNPIYYLVAIKRLIQSSLFHRFYDVIKFASQVLGVSFVKAIITLIRAEANSVATAHRFIKFKKIDARRLAELKKPNVRVVGSLGSDEERSQHHRPLMILQCSFTIHYLCVIELAYQMRQSGRDPELVISQPAAGLAPLLEIGFYQRLSHAANVKITTIAADHPTALAQIGKALARRAVVLTRIDSLPPKTKTFVVGSMFGVPSLFPGSLLIVAKRHHAAVVAAAVYMDGAVPTMHLDQIHDLSDVSDTEMSGIVVEMNSFLETKIKAMPHAYSSWYGLFEKNRMAMQVLDAAFKS